MSDATMRPGQQLADRFDAFNQEVIMFVEDCTDSDWQKITPAEGWPVGVTARHIAAGHYPLVEWVQMIVDEEPLPGVTMDDVNQGNDQHARDHAHCTKVEVLEILRDNSANALNYLSTLNDDDLERQGYSKLFGTDFSAGNLFSVLLIDIAGKHFESMKAAVAR